MFVVVVIFSSSTCSPIMGRLAGMGLGPGTTDMVHGMVHGCMVG